MQYTHLCYHPHYSVNDIMLTKLALYRTCLIDVLYGSKFLGFNGTNSNSTGMEEIFTEQIVGDLNLVSLVTEGLPK